MRGRSVDVMTTRLTSQQFTDLGLADWRVVRQGAQANFRCGSYSAAGQLAADVALLCEEHGHHVALDIRYPDLLHVTTSTHHVGGLSPKDEGLARAVSDLAASRGHRPEPSTSTSLEVAIDALDIAALLPFWRAVLAYEPETMPDGSADDSIVDPRGVGPSVWFQQMDEPRPQRNRIHLDVVVPHDEAEARVAAALDAGGHLVSDDAARAFWVLADAEGNEACVCTWQDRE